jgi:acyl-CoA synthetase (AMP-forming)/AMP-acid ligase II
MNLADALAHHVRARPDRPAILAGERVVLYRDLDGMVRRWAAHLQASGAKRGEVLGIALRDSIEHLVALYAAARMGAVSLPMDWRWTEAEKSAVATHFGAKLVLAEPDAPLLLSLSSGTTGRPKGPVVTHGQFLRRFWTHWIDLGLNARETYVSATPMYFGGGRTFCMSLLFSGGTAVLFPPPYKPEELAAEIARRNATSAFLVPTLLRRLLDLPEERTAPLKRMRLLLSSGAPLHPWERQAIRAKLCPEFHEYYASTEGGGVSLLRPEDMAVHPDSVGRPVFGVEVAILGDDDRPLPPGEVGRLAYRGPGVARGFHNDTAASAEAFLDGWFLPGDLAAVNEAGYVFLKGRRKDMIIRGGVNIHPAEIESVLLGDPRIAEAAVVAWPSADLGEEVAAFIVPRAGMAPPEEKDLIALCSGRLAPYKVPRSVFAIPDLPRNSAGKVVKTELTARLTPLPARRT